MPTIFILLATRTRKRHYILRHRCMKVCFIAVALAVTAAVGEISTPLAAATKQHDKSVLDLLVIDQTTRKPIPRVTLSIQKFRDNQHAETDERGHCLIPVSRELDVFLVITAQADGFISRRVWWRGKAPQEPIPIPSSYTLAIEKPVSIGGTVRDGKGHPVKDATVLFEWKHRQMGREISEVEAHGLRTDHNGRWRYDFMTANLANVAIVLIAPGFPTYDTRMEKSAPTVDELRSLTAVFTMEQGAKRPDRLISGRVLTDAGKPIRDADVLVNGGESDAGTTEVTCSDGSWSIDEVRPGPIVLTAQAEGYAPDLKSVMAKNDMAPVDFYLKRAQQIRVRIVDEQNEPIRDALVSSARWRGFRTLGWYAKTDADGRVCFSSAPPDKLSVSVEKTNYLSVQDFPVSYKNPESVIILKRAPRIRGRVVDAATGKSVDAFAVIRPTIAENGVWDDEWYDERFTNGSYEVAIDQLRPSSVVRIEADGYKPAVSRVLKTNEGDASLDFKLEHATAPVRP